uniref:Uncharacterized protein n=1 Tax=Rhizophora mucronata TaxID=61149 RepID=A0A2P2JJ97_RHIMU
MVLYFDHFQLYRQNFDIFREESWLYNATFSIVHCGRTRVESCFDVLL